MFRIAVCDDDPNELGQTLAILNRWRDAHSPQEEIVLDGFGAAGELLERLHGNRQFYDVLVLDILMPEMNGIDLGCRVRGQSDSPDSLPYLIYTTTSRDYAVDAFSARAYHYLLKPLCQEKLSAVMEELWVRVSQARNTAVAVSTAQGVVMVKAEQIVYIENSHRCPVYHLNNAPAVQGVVNRGTLEEAIGPLKDSPEFVCPHKSFWVNMRYIRRLQPKELCLDSGEQIPISRVRAAEVKRQYLKYITQEASHAAI